MQLQKPLNRLHKDWIPSTDTSPLGRTHEVLFMDLRDRFALFYEVLVGKCHASPSKDWMLHSIERETGKNLVLH